jgi:hypothetical protein
MSRAQLSAIALALVTITTIIVVSRPARAQGNVLHAVECTEKDNLSTRRQVENWMTDEIKVRSNEHFVVILDLLCAW